MTMAQVARFGLMPTATDREQEMVTATSHGICEQSTKSTKQIACAWVFRGACTASSSIDAGKDEEQQRRLWTTHPADQSLP